MEVRSGGECGAAGSVVHVTLLPVWGFPSVPHAIITMSPTALFPLKVEESCNGFNVAPSHSHSIIDIVKQVFLNFSQERKIVGEYNTIMVCSISRWLPSSQNWRPLLQPVPRYPQAGLGSLFHSLALLGLTVSTLYYNTVPYSNMFL